MRASHAQERDAVTAAPDCPHCRKPLPRKLVWRTLFAGQTAHACPKCRKRFRLTYAAKIRVGFLNVMLILGLTIVIGFTFLWTLPEILRNVVGYLAIAVLVLMLMPMQARYEKLGKQYQYRKEK